MAARNPAQNNKETTDPPPPPQRVVKYLEILSENEDPLCHPLEIRHEILLEKFSGFQRAPRIRGIRKESGKNPERIRKES